MATTQKITPWLKIRAFKGLRGPSGRIYVNGTHFTRNTKYDIKIESYTGVISAIEQNIVQSDELGQFSFSYPPPDIMRYALPSECILLVSISKNGKLIAIESVKVS
jgi:hypothetical protein